MEKFEISFILCFVTLIYSIQTVECVDCYQCNIYNQGIQDECGVSEREMYNCSACMKTFTLTYMHEQWRQYRYSTVISKYCVQPRQLMLSEGCYTKGAAAGFVRRCFCYSHFCNSGIVMETNCALFTIPIAIMILLFTLL